MPELPQKKAQQKHVVVGIKGHGTALECTGSSNGNFFKWMRRSDSSTSRTDNHLCLKRRVIN
ncbi:MAG: hypothetical protein WKF36_02140 [Candidatus Nitrosocosmicus sp.]